MERHQTARRVGDQHEWRRNWPMVLAAMVGVSFVSMPTASLGLFMAPLQREFGWSRTQISAGLTVFALITFLLMPLAGILVDRFGARRAALPGLALSGAAFATFGLMDGSSTQWFVIWVVFTLVSLAASLMVWTAAVSAAFGKGRGLALALVLCGSALAQAVAPLSARWLIDGFGWRGAYVGIAAVWGGLAFLLSLFFFRSRDQVASPSAVSAVPLAIGGLTAREAMRDATMLRLAFSTFLQTIVAAAVLVHLVPLLISIGVPRADAASLTLVLAISSIVGKLLTGALIDRVGASWLPFLCYVGPVGALALLYSNSVSLSVIGLAVAIQGYCAGATLHLTTYLTTRYAGLRNFGTIFGMISTLMALAGGLGPLIGGIVFDQSGSYALLLVGGIGLCLIAGLSVLGLGDYPDFSNAISKPADMLCAAGRQTNAVAASPRQTGGARSAVGHWPSLGSDR